MVGLSPSYLGVELALLLDRAVAVAIAVDGLVLDRAVAVAVDGLAAAVDGLVLDPVLVLERDASLGLVIEGFEPVPEPERVLAMVKELFGRLVESSCNTDRVRFNFRLNRNNELKLNESE